MQLVLLKMFDISEKGKLKDKLCQIKILNFHNFLVLFFILFFNFLLFKCISIKFKTIFKCFEYIKFNIIFIK